MAEKFTDEEYAELRRIAKGRTVILNATITRAEGDTDPLVYLGRGDMMADSTLDIGERVRIVGAGYDPNESRGLGPVVYGDSAVASD